ncbi:hypothetical protein EZV62_014916 [Acer yangbiense]|uniref:Uncharacterized protein n=1 Tax=Acer yangbiense TaxID=1000413 RepID=A0A5C7HTA9_9ROSI|nr:hypothetical protein EZV62_014916 [Acer yangbiense]
MVGEIGGNDYNYALFQAKTIEDLKANLVPRSCWQCHQGCCYCTVLLGTRVIVPGNFPIGCFLIYLTGFRTNDSSAYDECRCLKELNYFSIFHNDHLKQAIQELQKENPGLTAITTMLSCGFGKILLHSRMEIPQRGLRRPSPVAEEASPTGSPSIVADEASPTGVSVAPSQMELHQPGLSRPSQMELCGMRLTMETI